MQESAPQAPPTSPPRNWKSIAALVALAVIAPILFVFLITQWLTSGTRGMHEDQTAILARIQPVGQLQLAAAGGAKGQLAGEEVFTQVCKTCHEAGLLNAPKFKDKTAWAKVIAQGRAVAVEHAIKGIRAMPPKGGNADLTDIEVERAVVFMANAGGASWKEPAAAPAPAAPAKGAAQAAAPAETAKVAAAPAAAAPAAAKPDGKKIFETTCTVCHGTGVAGAPKFGDKAAWAPRIATGLDTLVKTAIAGKGAMPAKGGNNALSDAEVRAAVEFMVSAAR
jgi:cytochrome c5